MNATLVQEGTEADDPEFRCAHTACGRRGRVVRDLALVQEGGLVFCSDGCLAAHALDAWLRDRHPETLLPLQPLTPKPQHDRPEGHSR